MNSVVAQVDFPEVEPVTDVKALTHLFFFCVCVSVSTQKLHDTSPRLLMALNVACLGNHWIAWLHVCVCKHKCVHNTMSDDSKKHKVEHEMLSDCFPQSTFLFLPKCVLSACRGFSF